MHHRRLIPVLATLTLAAAATAAAADEDSGRVFMWEVRSDTATVFLLGSVHAARPDLYPLDPMIEDAFERAEVTAFETDLGDLQGAAMSMLSAGTLEPGTRLAEVVSESTHSALTARLEDAGLPASGFESMRPWLVALTLTSTELMRAGYGMDSGIDLHMWRRAQKKGLERIALEPVDAQIELFANLTPAESEAFLAMTLDELDGLSEMLDELTRRWLAGDAEHAAGLLTESFEEFPRLYDALVVDRNLDWLPTIEKLLGGDRDALVVVGALHLVGGDGLPAMLSARGFDVVQAGALATAVD